MIHAQGIVFDTNTDIIIDSATFARLLRLNTQNLSRFYVKTKSYKTNSFHSAKNACFPGKKTTQQKLGQLTRQYQFFSVIQLADNQNKGFIHCFVKSLVDSFQRF